MNPFNKPSSITVAMILTCVVSVFMVCFATLAAPAPDMSLSEAFRVIANTGVNDDLDLNGHDITDAGAIDASTIGSDIGAFDNITVGEGLFDGIVTTSLTAPTGRQATFTISSCNSTATEISQADYRCDGVDDQIQINTAIEAAPTQGALIHLCSGPFVVKGSVTPKHDIWIEGCGVDVTTIVQADGANIANGVFYANGNFNRGALMRLGIDGNKANNPTGTYGVYLRGVWYAKIVHVAIHDCKQDGFRSSTTEGGIYCGEIFHSDVASYDNDVDGFALAGSGDNYLEDCYAYGNLIIGFHCSMTHNAMFHCHPYDNGWYGISLDNTSDHNGIFDACLDRNYRAGIFVQGDYNRIIGCYALGNSKDGVGAYSGFRVTGTYNTFTGNIAKDPDTPQCQHYGIEEQTTADYNAYVGNILDMNLHDALVIVGVHSENTTNIF